MKIRLGLAAAALAVAGMASVVPHTMDRPVAPEASTVTELPAGLAPALAAALAPPEYHLAPSADGWQAANPAQRLAVDFSPDGLRAVPAAGGQSLGLSLSRLGRQGDLRAPAPARLDASGARIDYRRGNVTEWYVNDARGVEQGFTLESPPAGDRAHPVVVELATAGGLRPALDASGAAVRFEGPATTLHYGGLHAFDATGRAVPSRLGVDGQHVTLTVDDAGASYPLTIDPLLTEQAHLFPADPAAGDSFGHSVAVSGDTAVVGVPADDTTTGGTNAGSAYVFVRTAGVWSQQAHLFAADDALDDRFGESVAISGDTALVGASRDDYSGIVNGGSAYVFVRSAGAWSQQAKLLPTAPAREDEFGRSVALSGDTAVVGAPDDDTADGIDAGSAYIFVRSGVAWSKQAQVFGSAPAEGVSFGSSVAVSGDTAVVGVHQQDIPGASDAGAAFVFVRSGGAWAEQALLVVNDAAADDLAGRSVAVSGDTVVVGVPRDDTGGVGNAGSARVFVRSGSTWSEQASLVAADGAAGDQLGWDVKISGDTVVAGANGDDTPGAGNSGSAYVFVRSAGTWSEHAHLVASDRANSDAFGNSVAVSGDIAVVGAYTDDTPAGADAGSVYVFGTVLPTLAIDDVTLAEGNSGTTTFTFTVTRTGDLGAAASVNWSTADGSAVAPEDYTSVEATTISFAAGEATQTVSVTVVGDTVTEANDGFTVNLANPVGAVITDGTGVGRITNDDAGSFSVNDVTVTEGDSGTTTATFTITRSGGTGGTATVRWNTLDAQAKAGSDYVAVAPTAVTFGPGETTKTVNVVVNGDTVVESTETFYVRLSAPVGATIADGSSTATITNDDIPGSFSVDDVTVTEGDSATTTATFTITRSGAAGTAASVSWNTLNARATAPSDYVAVAPTVVNFAPGDTTKTVTVTVNGDTTVEITEFFYLRLSAPVGATIADGSGMGTITNDD